MERVQVNTNFYLDEFVDPHTFFTRDDHGLSLVDERLFHIAQLLRYHYMAPVYINNWWKYYLSKKDVWSIEHIIKRIEESGLHKWSGIRTSRTDVGSVRSAHRVEVQGKGMAIDPKGNEIKFYNIVKKNAEVFYNLGVRRLEDIRITPGWLHLDTLERNTTKNSIRVVDRVKHVRTIYF